jgi:hypothetical protein
MIVTFQNAISLNNTHLVAGIIKYIIHLITEIVYCLMLRTTLTIMFLVYLTRVLSLGYTYNFTHIEHKTEPPYRGIDNGQFMQTTIPQGAKSPNEQLRCVEY